MKRIFSCKDYNQKIGSQTGRLFEVETEIDTVFCLENNELDFDNGNFCIYGTEVKSEWNAESYELTDNVIKINLPYSLMKGAEKNDVVEFLNNSKTQLFHVDLNSGPMYSFNNEKFLEYKKLEYTVRDTLRAFNDMTGKDVKLLCKVEDDSYGYDIDDENDIIINSIPDNAIMAHFFKNLDGPDVHINWNRKFV